MLALNPDLAYQLPPERISPEVHDATYPADWLAQLIQLTQDNLEGELNFDLAQRVNSHVGD